MADSDFAMAAEGPLAVDVTRSFGHAPEKVIWAFLDPEMMRAWMGAEAMPLEVCDCDPQVGGRFRHAWALPDGSKSWCAGSFTAVEHDHLVHTEVWKPDVVAGAFDTGTIVAPARRTSSLTGTHSPVNTTVSQASSVPSSSRTARTRGRPTISTTVRPVWTGTRRSPAVSQRSGA